MDVIMFLIGIVAEILPIIVCIVLFLVLIYHGSIIVFLEFKARIKKLLFKCGFRPNPESEWKLTEEECFSVLCDVYKYNDNIFDEYIIYQINKFKVKDKYDVYKCKRPLLVAKILSGFAAEYFKHEDMYCSLNSKFTQGDYDKEIEAIFLTALAKANNKKTISAEQYNKYPQIIRDGKNPFECNSNQKGTNETSVP